MFWAVSDKSAQMGKVAPTLNFCLAHHPLAIHQTFHSLTMTGFPKLAGLVR